MIVETEANRAYAEWALKECRTKRSRKIPQVHQTEALDALNQWYARFSREDEAGGLLVLPTGAGKTFTAVHFLCNGPLSDGYKVLWLAHTHHLLEQAFSSFSAEALAHVREPREWLSIRVVSGTTGHYPPRDIRVDDDIVIATLQTATGAHRGELPQYLGFLESAGQKLFVVFDEAHHAPAPSFRKLILELRRRGAPVLGLTATPTYADERKRGWLKTLFPQGILAEADSKKLMLSGILSRPNFEKPKTSFKPDFDPRDYQKWLGTYGDLPEDVIKQLAENADRNALIAQTYVTHREKYRKTIIFTDRWYQCEQIVAALERRGVKAGAVYSHVDAQAATVEERRRRTADENARILEQFRNNEIEVLVNVRMLTEGTDIPDAQTVFLTRQTTSRILFTQMIGRALRGPKFGGTPEAWIVSFVDEWQQNIRWAEYGQLPEGQADDDEAVSMKRPPLFLISIDLVKRLARQMDSGTNVTPGPFTSLMPLGWYRVSFEACAEGSDDAETEERLVMVFEDEKDGFESLLGELGQGVPEAFVDPGTRLEEARPALEEMCSRHLGGAVRTRDDLHVDVFHLARHVGQGNGIPRFFTFEVRDDHDLDKIAEQCIQEDLGPRAIQGRLSQEYHRTDRFWATLFTRFDQFRSYYDACSARALDGVHFDVPVKPRGGAPPSFSEPDEGTKARVRARDGERCLACGMNTRRYLEVDHVVPVYHGGTSDDHNLQTLCGTCNRYKRESRTVRFTAQATPLKAPPVEMDWGKEPADPLNREHWERFLRGTINFTYQCAAVAGITVAGRGHGYYHWRVDLYQGNPVALVEPLMRGLFERINDCRKRAGRLIESITITDGDGREVSWPPEVRRS